MKCILCSKLIRRYVILLLFAFDSIRENASASSENFGYFTILFGRYKDDYMACTRELQNKHEHVTRNNKYALL